MTTRYAVQVRLNDIGEWRYFKKELDGSFHGNFASLRSLAKTSPTLADATAALVDYIERWPTLALQDALRVIKVDVQEPCSQCGRAFE